VKTSAPDQWFVWANESEAQGMLKPEAWERRGWVKVRRHPFWPASWLMELPPAEPPRNPALDP
jgi:hypothetical protein